MLCTLIYWYYGAGPTVMYDMHPWALEYALNHCV